MAFQKQPYLTLTKLEVSFLSRRALSDISCSIMPGERIAILGPNGAGKSTLLRAVLGLVPFQQGRVEIKGQDLRTLDARARAKAIAYLPQDLNLLHSVSVFDFVLSARFAWFDSFGVPRKTDCEQARWALAQVGLLSFYERDLATLSGGERQRVMLAAAIAQGSEMLLLDEPTSSLDPNHVSEFLDVLTRVGQELNKTIMIVTHEINVALLWSSRILGLRQGKLVYDGPTNELLSGGLEKIFDRTFATVRHPASGSELILPG